MGSIPTDSMQSRRETMKAWQFSVILLLISNAAAEAGISNGRSWAFMESVGGIAIGSPSQSAGTGLFLPVTCDVSGLRMITRKPTSLNSALVVTNVDKEIEGKKILISVKTGLPSGTKSSTCPGVDLGDLPAGDYQVFYLGADREEHSLGKLTVPFK